MTPRLKKIPTRGLRYHGAEIVLENIDCVKSVYEIIIPTVPQFKRHYT